MGPDVIVAQSGAPAGPGDVLSISYLAVLLVVIGVFLVVLVTQGYVKDFKKRQSQIERQVSAIFTEKDSCNHCGNNVGPSTEAVEQCPQCGQNPYQIPAIIKSRELVNMIRGADRCPRCNMDLEEVQSENCPNCEVRRNTVVDAFGDVVCANPSCNKNLKPAQDIQGGPVSTCPRCGTPNPYNPTGSHQPRSA